MRLYYPLNRRLDGPQTWFVLFGVEKNLLPVYLSIYSCEKEDIAVKRKKWMFPSGVLRHVYYMSVRFPTAVSWC